MGGLIELCQNINFSTKTSLRERTGKPYTVGKDKGRIREHLHINHKKTTI